jgi:hypothetical protein
MLPEGKRFWLDDTDFPLDKEGLPTPTFKVKEVAEVFFGKSDDWLRWRMRPNDRRVRNPETGEVELVPGDHPDGYFILDGSPMEFKRTESGARYFTLADIERMATALAQGGHIDGARFTLVIKMVVTCARLHGVTA